MALRLICRGVIMAIGIVVVMAGSVERWSDGRHVAWLEGLHSRYAWSLRSWMHSEWFAATPLNSKEVGWVLMVTGVLIWGLAKPLCHPVADLLWLLSVGTLKKRFRITVTETHVKLSRWWGTQKLARGDVGEGQVQVRVVSPDEYFSRLSMNELQARRVIYRSLRNPPAIVEVVQGFRRHKLLMARRTDEAEAIVLRINEALLATA